MAGDFSAFLLEYECEMCVDVPGLILYQILDIVTFASERCEDLFACTSMVSAATVSCWPSMSIPLCLLIASRSLLPCSPIADPVFFPTTPCESSVAGVSVTGHLTVINSSDPPCMIHGEVVWSCDFQCVYTYNYVYRCMLCELNVYDECCVSNLMSL